MKLLFGVENYKYGLAAARNFEIISDSFEIFET
jgi:hypothetical protein